MTLNLKFKTSLATLAMVASAGALAVPLSGAVVTGYATGFSVSGSTLVATSYPAGLSGSTLSNLLTGNAASPTGNVELGLLGSSTTTLTGVWENKTIAISGLTAADWTSSLAQQYITAAASAIGATLTAPQLDLATNFFLLGTVANSVLHPYQFVSDPNISYANVDGGILSIGLAGYFDATPVLAALFPGQTVPAGSQASEVVKVSVNGGPAQYLYSFFATPSGLTNAVVPTAFTGNYEVTLTVPEPGSLALLGFGLAGLAAVRRRKIKASA